MPDGNLDVLAEAFGVTAKVEAEPKKPTVEAVAVTPIDEEAPAPEVEETAETEDAVDETESGEENVADESEGETDEIHTVKVNGEELAVTTTELKAGYMKDADYRKKTEEVANVRKAVEADKERFDKGIKTLVEQLAIADQLIRESSLNLTDEQLDQLAVENPAEFVRMQRLMEKSEAKRHQIAEASRRAQEEYFSHQRTELQNRRKAELAELAKELPEFRKAETLERVTFYVKGEGYGFSDDVLNTITDRRFFKLADKARRYDALMAKGKDKQEKVAQKVLKPNASSLKQQDEKATDFQRKLAQVKKGNKDSLNDVMSYF